MLLLQIAKSSASASVSRSVSRDEEEEEAEGADAAEADDSLVEGKGGSQSGTAGGGPARKKKVTTSGDVVSVLREYMEQDKGEGAEVRKGVSIMKTE